MVYHSEVHFLDGEEEEEEGWVLWCCRCGQGLGRVGVRLCSGLGMVGVFRVLKAMELELGLGRLALALG